eukprot:gb/GEZJ01004299.1/.p1 GENE.gb/GEZJ01004299.1/~~gb/GEZJ01004299.1/.p1  ORF type:complete len:240 (+),score=12.95 gb/GEZJ01004299.1/:55-774(+)
MKPRATRASTGRISACLLPLPVLIYMSRINASSCLPADYHTTNRSHTHPQIRRLSTFLNPHRRAFLFCFFFPPTRQGERFVIWGAPALKQHISLQLRRPIKVCGPVLKQSSSWTALYYVLAQDATFGCLVKRIPSSALDPSALLPAFVERKHVVQYRSIVPVGVSTRHIATPVNTHVLHDSNARKSIIYRNEHVPDKLLLRFNSQSVRTNNYFPSFLPYLLPSQLEEQQLNWLFAATRQ